MSNDDRLRALESKIDRMTATLEKVLEVIGPSISVQALAKGIISTRFGLGDTTKAELVAAQTEIDALTSELEKVRSLESQTKKEVPEDEEEQGSRVIAAAKTE